MSLRCELTGKGPAVKNLVSHAHNKTKKWQKPNVHKRRVYSDVLGERFTLKVCNRALRSIDHAGGLDNFILRQPLEKLSPRARTLRTRIRRARS